MKSMNELVSFIFGWFRRMVLQRSFSLRGHIIEIAFALFVITIRLQMHSKFDSYYPEDVVRSRMIFDGIKRKTEMPTRVLLIGFQLSLETMYDSKSVQRAPPIIEHDCTRNDT